MMHDVQDAKTQDLDFMGIININYWYKFKSEIINHKIQKNEFSKNFLEYMSWVHSKIKMTIKL